MYRDSLEKSKAHLLKVGAVAESAAGDLSVTSRGQALNAMPVDIEMGVSILEAAGHNCSEDVAIIACVAVAGGGRLFTGDGSALNHFAAASGDHETYLNVYEAWVASGKDSSWCHQQGLSAKSLEIADELLVKVHSAIGRHNVPGYQFQGDAASRSAAILQSLCAGYHHQCATPADPSSAKSAFWLVEDFDVNPQSATLHRRSALYKKTDTGTVMFSSQTAYADGARVLCAVSKVEAAWLAAAAAGAGVSPLSTMSALNAMARSIETVAVTPSLPQVGFS